MNWEILALRIAIFVVLLETLYYIFVNMFKEDFMEAKYDTDKKGYVFWSFNDQVGRTKFTAFVISAAVTIFPRVIAPVIAGIAILILLFGGAYGYFVLNRKWAEKIIKEDYKDYKAKKDKAAAKKKKLAEQRKKKAVAKKKALAKKGTGKKK